MCLVLFYYYSGVLIVYLVMARRRQMARQEGSAIGRNADADALPGRSLLIAINRHSSVAKLNIDEHSTPPFSTLKHYNEH